MQIIETDLEKRNKIEGIIKKIKDKKSKIIFCIPKAELPSASVYEIYFHANTMKNCGYDVKLLIENDYVIPSWVDLELVENIEHLKMDDPKLSVGAEDILVIPEVFTNIMEQVKKLPCLKVVLLQSIDHMLNALVPGVNYNHFGINKVITTSQTLKNILLEHYNKIYDVYTYDIGIPDYFKNQTNPQKLVISILGRNTNEISKIVKLFYSKYPYFNWITFDTLVSDSKPPQPLSRFSFAERLRDNFAAIWIDRLASFGTFPIEVMKSGSILIALKPDITPEYITKRNADGVIIFNENAGLWTDDIYSLPTMIGDVITKYIDNSIDNKVYEGMNEVSIRYNQSESAKQIEKIYTDLFNERINLLNETL